MVDLIGYNMKLKKKEKMNSPSLVIFKGTGNRKDRYACKGKGSDGTVMFKILGEDLFNKLKAEGLSVEVGKAKEKGSKKSKKSAEGGKRRSKGSRKSRGKSRGSRK